MDLRQLRTFLHVAELGSLGRAAERLRVAQPALGRQIRLLEEELGVPLFTRHGRGMAPTPAGRILLDRASAILRLVADTRAEVSAERDAVKRSEEHTSELQSLMRISYAVFCLKKKKATAIQTK